MKGAGSFQQLPRALALPEDAIDFWGLQPEESDKVRLQAAVLFTAMPA
jgi:hypothetical protein